MAVRKNLSIAAGKVNFMRAETSLQLGLIGIVTKKETQKIRGKFPILVLPLFVISCIDWREVLKALQILIFSK